MAARLSAVQELYIFTVFGQEKGNKEDIVIFFESHRLLKNSLNKNMVPVGTMHR